MQRLLPFFSLALIVHASAGTGQPVLVVPFLNQSSEKLDWISESLAVTIREALASHGILALGRDDRQEAYRRLSIRPDAQLTRASAIKLAEALDAASLVHGRFEVAARDGAAPGAPPTLRITGFVIDTQRLRKSPDFRESGPIDELALLQSRIAWQILHHLSPETAPPADRFLRERQAIRVDALESYVRGLLAPADEQRHRLFTQAVRMDERFSPPKFELGRMYWGKKDYGVAARWLSEVLPSDPRHLEATFLLGLCRFRQADYDGAQKAFSLVAESVPLNEVLNNLGAALSRANRPDALENFRKALEGDTSDPDYHFNVGYALWKAGRFDEAAESFRAALARSSEDTEATLMLGRCLQRAAPTAAELRGLGRERIKLNYEETAYRQLKAALERKR
jgi:tetratricopeptide (TPR) repeat protein